MDRFKAVDAEQFGDVHRAGFGNAAQVVAHQVADHDVFPAFLGVVLQLLGQRVVFFRVLPRRMVPLMGEEINWSPRRFKNSSGSRKSRGIPRL